MAKCSCCGVEFNVEDVREQFEHDDWIVARNLQAHYEDYPNLCFNCEFSAVSADYNTGMEILSLMDDDD